MPTWSRRRETNSSPREPTDTTRDLLFYAGLAIASLGFLLLALAWFARRYFADPLAVASPCDRQ